MRISTMDIVVRRNAYGRQSGSFFVKDCFAGKPIPMPFIRAPYIYKVGDGVEVLAEVGGKIVAAREGSQLVTAFHPELTTDATVHSYFMQLVKRAL